MRYLRTNTATIVTVGPFLDKTDGVTLETGLTITNEKISFTVDLNEGSAPTLVLDNITGATSGTANDLNYIANCDAGLMQIELAAADVNYLGRAFLTITDAANHCPVFHEFTILPANVYDSLILGSGTDYLDISVVQLAGSAIDQSGGLINANVKQISADGTAADRLEALLDATPTGVVVDDDDPNPSATAFETNLSMSSDGINDAFCVFSSGALLGQSQKISDWDNTSKILTVAKAFTAAPAAGDAFLVVGKSA